MFSRWLKRSNRLDHPDADKRLAAVQALGADDARARQADLKRLIEQDNTAAIVDAAIDKLTDDNVCAELLNHEPVSARVAERIAALVASGVDSSSRSDPRVLSARIEQADLDQLPKLLSDIDSAEHCAALALRFRDASREQILSHPLLQSEAGLTQLVKQAKGRDKQCHRYARDRLDAIKQARAACTEHAARLAEIDQAIEKTQASEQDDYARIQKLSKMREMRAEVVEGLESERATLTSAGGAAGDFPTPADPLAGMNLEPPEPAADPFPELVQVLDTLSDTMRKGVDPGDITTVRERVTNTWLTEADRHPPAPAQHARFEAVSAQFQTYRRAWEKLANLNVQSLDDSAAALAEDSSLKAHRQWLKRWRKKVNEISWPVDHELPAALQSAQETLAKVEAATARLSDKETDAERRLAEHVAAAQTAIEGGHVRDAVQALKQARGLQKNGLSSHDRELAALSAQLDEFRDWQQFATNPKREALLSQISELAEHPAEPATQASRLKALRAEWQQLGRPANADEAAQQETFDEMAEKAYEPCRVYYEEQASLRAANLEQRAKLCDQLEAYLENTDWETADMRAAENIIRTARDEWRKHHPCERKALKPVETRFEALQQTLHDKLKVSWDSNVKAKEAIVAEARQLLEQELDVQINEAKRLQQVWRDVGPTPRGPDQKLWREFRQLCDQIFATRDTAKAEAQAAYTAQQSALEDALAALEALVATDGAVDPSAWRSARASYDEQAGIARPSGGQRKRLDGAERAWRERLADEKRHAELAELSQWSQWDQAMSHAEQNAAAIEAPHKWFHARAAGSATACDWLKLVIEAEIAADMPSPEADHGRRMEIQVEMMNAGVRPQDHDYKYHLQRWCESGPKDAAADALRERFFAALTTRVEARNASRNSLRN